MPLPKTFSRRAALAGMAALPLVGCGGSQSSGGSASGEPTFGQPTPVPTPTPNSIPTTPSLDALAQQTGRRFGSAIASTPSRLDTGSIQNTEYADVIKAECGIVVPENEMKWQTVRPDPVNYDFSRMDGIVDWASTNGLDVRGHTLLWHRPEWFPDWLNTYDFGANPVAEAERLLTEHIRTVTDRYRGTISSYDVVNEAIDHDRNLPIETSLSRAMGSPESVLDLAFHTTRDQIPDAQLVYNDYMSWESGRQQHCTDVLRLLEGFRNRGTPVDVLGIQSHIEMLSIDPQTGLGPYDEAAWRAFLDEVVDMGYRLMITEFDVKDKALPADITQRDQKVADYTRRYLDLMLEYGDHLDDILAWGMVDKFNWLQYFDVATRTDGLEVRGSVYDSNYQAKPIRTAIADAFRAV